MANSKREDNRVTNALAWDATNSTTKNLLVDPITGRLLIDVTLVADYVEVTHTVAGHDDNHIPSLCLTNDNAAGASVPMLVDNSSNFLLVDLIAG